METLKDGCVVFVNKLCSVLRAHKCSLDLLVMTVMRVYDHLLCGSNIYFDSFDSQSSQ